MRSRGAKSALVAGLLAGALALVAESQVAAAVALGAVLVLLSTAVLLELAQRGDSANGTGVNRIEVTALFGCGVVVFADDRVLAGAAGVATIVLLLVIGFVEGHLRAVWWAAVLLMSALTADILWQVGLDPFDRSDEYEPIPQSPFVLLGLPLPMAVVAAGVGARWMWRQLRRV
jgi:hypothetical protein